MLKFFSRLERTRNFILLFFAILMVLSLIVAGSLFRDDTPRSITGAGETVATVSSEKVTTGDIAALKQGQMSRYPSKPLLNSLIGQRIMRVEADRLGLRASDAEVANAIREENKSEDGKPIDIKRYEQWATQNFGSVKAYEQSMRDRLSAQKLQAFLTAGVTVSEEDVLKDFQRKNSKFDLTYVPVSVADLAQTIKPTDEEMKAYFEKNKANYYISVPQKKIRYIFLSSVKMGEKLPLTDEELRAAYDKIPPDKRTKGVEGQQIVLRIPKPELKTQILEKANEIADRAKKDNGKISEEAFTELVNGYSEDAASKARGGKLPALVRENLNQQNNPSAVQPPPQAILELEEGEVTDPIEANGNFYIFRRGKEVPKTFEDAKPELEVSLRNSKGFSATQDLAQKAAEDLKQTKDVQATAQKFAAQANMSVTEMIRETPFVKPGDNIENVGVSPQFEKGIESLENPNDVGDKFQVQNGFAVPLLVEKRPERDATFEEVKDQITETVKLDKARAQVEEIAKQIAAGATSAGDLTAAAQSKGLKTQDQKGFILGSPLGQGPQASTNDALEDAIYALKSGEVTKTPLKVGDNWYIVGVTNRQEANMDDFAKQRDQLIQTMEQQKRGQVFSDYLASVRQTMEKNGDIKIYNDVLERFDAATTEPAVPALPALPGAP